MVPALSKRLQVLFSSDRTLRSSLVKDVEFRSTIMPKVVRHDGLIDVKNGVVAIHNGKNGEIHHRSDKGVAPCLVVSRASNFGARECPACRRRGCSVRSRAR